MEERVVLDPVLEAACWGPDARPALIGRLRRVCRMWRNFTRPHLGGWLGALLGVMPKLALPPLPRMGSNLVNKLGEWATALLEETLDFDRLPLTIRREIHYTDKHEYSYHNYPGSSLLRRATSEELMLAALRGSQSVTPRLLDQLLRTGTGTMCLQKIIEIASTRSNVPVLDWAFERLQPGKNKPALAWVLACATTVNVVQWLGRQRVAAAWRDRGSSTLRHAGRLALRRACGKRDRAFAEALADEVGCRGHEIGSVFTSLCRLGGALDTIKWMADRFKITKLSPFVIGRLPNHPDLATIQWIVDRFQINVAGLNFYLPGILAADDVERARWIVGHCQMGADDVYRNDALQRACAAGALRSVEWMTREFPVTTDTFPNWRAALDGAAKGGCTPLVLLLVERMEIKFDMVAPADF